MSRFMLSRWVDYEIDSDIDTFEVFDNIIKNYGCITTIDSDTDKQPTRQTNDYFHCTLEEIAEQLNVTRERIRQIESNALRKLKHPSRSHILKEFFK